MTVKSGPLGAQQWAVSLFFKPVDLTQQTTHEEVARSSAHTFPDGSTEHPMSGNDYYKTLGVTKTASDAEIKSAYRRLAKKHHPDRNKDDKSATEKFKRLQEAYDVLRNREKRQQYDQFGTAGVGHFVENGGKKYYSWGGDSNINVDDLDDLFSAFGGNGAPERS